MNIKGLEDRYSKLREDKGLSIVQLAKQLNSNPKTISFYENGKREMPRNVILKYAEFFNTSANYLLGLSDDPHSKPVAVDELRLSPTAISFLRRYSVVTNYDDRSVLDFLLTHRKFEDVLLAVAHIMECDYRANKGLFDMSKLQGFHPLSVVRNIVPDDYNEPIDKIIECFGRGSVIVSGENIVRYEAFAARKAFDSILDSLIEDVLRLERRNP